VAQLTHQGPGFNYNKEQIGGKSQYKMEEFLTFSIHLDSLSAGTEVRGGGLLILLSHSGSAREQLRLKK
jgi:hypothetical protein